MDDRRLAGSVEILCDQTGKFWVNVDGACALRIGYVAELRIETSDLNGGKLRVQRGTIKYPVPEFYRNAEIDPATIPNEQRSVPMSEQAVNPLFAPPEREPLISRLRKVAEAAPTFAPLLREAALELERKK